MITPMRPPKKSAEKAQLNSRLGQLADELAALSKRSRKIQREILAIIAKLKAMPRRRKVNGKRP
jgi:hypothetical protein